MDGAVEVGLWRRDVEDGHYVLETTFKQVLVDGQAWLELTPTDGTNAWMVHEIVPNGITRYLAVPAQDDAEYVDLVDLDPLSLLPNADGAVAAWAELGSRINALPKVVALSQAAYDAMSNPDSTTMYLIVS